MLPEGILVFVLISLSALIKWRSESLDHHLRVCLMALRRPWQLVEPSWAGCKWHLYMSHIHQFVPNAFLFMIMFCQAEFLLGEQQ